MDLTEHTVESRTLFEGHIVKLTLDRARLPDGTLADQVMDGTITDAKTVATTLKVKVLLGL